MPQSIVQPLRRWDPERVGPYLLIGKLGAGAMGQVFLARSAAGRLVAVKTIRVELAEEPGYRDRFAREVAAARRVSGVFTAAVIEADAEADLPWVATAYVPAPSLSTLVRRYGPLPVPAVRWLAAGCAEALQSIHGVGLLHRDVKPSNVLVAPGGPQVIDFGVARAAERLQLTATRGAGTPAYMAPEQARDGTLASSASDVFSLGATLVFAATGHPPYRGKTAMDILVRLATEPPDLTGLPGELTALVAACLERVPRDRPTTAAIVAELGSFAFPPGPGPSCLPGPALAVIAEYQRDPRLPVAASAGGAGADGAGADGAGADGAGADGSDGAAESEDGSGGEGGADRADGGTNGSGPLDLRDTTAGSHTALPGFAAPAALRRPPGPPDTSRPAAGGPATGRSARGGRGQRARGGQGSLAWTGRGPLAWAGLAAAAVVLVGAGTGAGLLLRGSADPAASTASATIPVMALPCVSVLPPGGGPPGSVPPSGSPAAAGGATTPSGSPQLCVSQPYGDGATVYVLHGTGFIPFQPVTVRLTGVGVSPYRPLADQQGTFNYAIDQGHYFFRGAIPPGRYTAVVTAAGGRRVSVTFSVYRASGQPAPAGS